MLLEHLSAYLFFLFFSSSSSEPFIHWKTLVKMRINEFVNEFVLSTPVE
jgi:hypothetical protein